MKDNLDNEKLEQVLGSALSPVTPTIDFVSDLQKRLRRNALVAVENPDYLIIVIFILSGLFIGVILIWLIKLVTDFFKSND